MAVFNGGVLSILYFRVVSNFETIKWHNDIPSILMLFDAYTRTHSANQLTVNLFHRFPFPSFFSLSRVLQVYYYIVDSPRNEGKEFFEINLQSGEIFTKIVFDREKQGAYALEVEARDGAPSARPNSNGQPNSGT